MLPTPAPVNNLTIPDISHLAGDWLTVARMHVSILTWDEADETDRQMSASGLRSLLKNYAPGKPFRGIQLLNNRRAQPIPAPAKPAPSKRKRGQRPAAVLPEGTMNIYEAALVIGVAPKTVRKYCVEGLWRSVRVGRTIAVFKDQEFKLKWSKPGAA